MTPSPSLAEAQGELGAVEAAAGEGQDVTVSWAPVQCGLAYQVFRKVGGGAWQFLETVEEPQLITAGLPCTEVYYGVKVILLINSLTVDIIKVNMSGALSDMVATDSPVSLPLDPSLPFLAAGLELEVLEEGVLLSWLGPPCVTSYRARACRGGDCREARLEELGDGLNTSLVISGLEPCQDYSLHLHAVSEGEELDAEQRNFTSKCLEHGLEPEPDEESPPETELESELQPEPEVNQLEDAGDCTTSDFGCCPNSTYPQHGPVVPS